MCDSSYVTTVINNLLQINLRQDKLLFYYLFTVCLQHDLEQIIKRKKC